MSYYQRNRAKARTKTTQPSLTDQSQARETDINIIVGRMLHSGTAPGAFGQPISGDFTNLPTDLRGFIHTSRKLRLHLAKLPKQLHDLTPEQLLALTPAELKNKLTPPAPTPEPKKDDQK